MNPLLRTTLLEENTELDYVASAFPSDTDHEAILFVESAIPASRVPEGNSRAMHSGIVSQKKWAPSVTIWRVSLYSMRSLKRVFIYNTVFLFL